MFDVMIIEDDASARERLKSIISWDTLSARLVCEAEDSDTALELYEIHHPKIIITDINIPIISGLDLAKELQKDDPGLRFIIITGYNDFDLVRQSVDLRAVSLLSKPIQPHEINSSIATAIQSIKQEREKESSHFVLESIVKNNLPELQKTFMGNLLRKEPAAEAVVQKKMDQLKIPLEGQHYLAAVISLRADGDDQDNQDAVALLLQEKFSQQMTGESDTFFSFVDDHFRLVCVIASDKPDIDSVLETALVKIRNELESSREVFLFAGIGPVVQSVAQLYISHTGALAALNYRSMLGDDSISHYKNLEKMETSLSVPEPVWGAIRKLFRAGDSGAIKETITRHIDFLSRQPAREKLIQNFFVEYVTVMTNESIQMGLQMEQMECCATLMTRLFQSANIVDCTDDAIGLADKLIFQIQSQKNANFNYLISKARDYIRQNVDGEAFVTLENFAAARSGIYQLNTTFNLLRNATAAASDADNLDVSITNLCVGLAPSAVDELLFGTIKEDNLKEDTILTDLYLPTVWTDERLATTAIQWASSDETAISSQTGKVTRPAYGSSPVSLTATFSDGSSKVFELLVPGYDTSSGNVLVLKGDRDPATGSGAATEEPWFTLDASNSSVIIDLQASQKVNVVKLTDRDTYARLNSEVLTLWVSEDNVTYTQVKGFKLLHHGKNWYLYDFAATGRYIKVHCTHFDSKEASFTAIPATMIEAYYEAVFGGEALSGAQEISFTNSSAEPCYDRAWEISRSELNLTGDYSKIRVYAADGELLYHYVTDDALIVRIPEVPGGKNVTVKLTVRFGDASAMDISNKEAVYEVTYGTREAWDVRAEVRWIYGPLSDGTILGVRDDATNNCLLISTSANDGRTWSTAAVIPATVGQFTGMGGFGCLADTLFIFGYLDILDENGNIESRNIHIIRSKDQGKSWEYVGAVENPNAYKLLTYTDAITLSSADGAGSGVDMVFPVNRLHDDGTSGCLAAYTTDGGVTWKLSYELYDDAAAEHEDGLSEATVMEREDGTLVMLIRHQGSAVDTFAVACSYDQGRTWKDLKQSSVYTVNTQPMMFRYRNDIMLSWGGNNMCGGLSRLRTPFSVAISYDGMETFENIQDLYVKYSLQGMTMSNQNRITNQKVVITQNDTFLSCWMNLTNNQSDWSNVMLRVEDFHDYFYRTKNAYDSFESGSVKYEGWSVVGGMVELSDAYASDGSYSMKLTDGSIAARSIPYFQNGTISMDIYVDGTASFNLDLQSAYTNVAKKGAPLGIEVVNNAITFYGAGTVSGLTLQNGWNTLTFELDLDAKTPAATLSVNGGAAMAMPVDSAIGDYVCFITPITTGTLYIDNVLAESDVDALNNTMEIVTDSASVSLDEDVRINWYVSLRGFDAIDAVQKGGLLIWNSAVAPEEAVFGTQDVHKAGLIYTGEANLYGQRTDGIVAKAYADELYIRVYVEVAPGEYVYSELKEYSVQKYCESRIKNSSNADMRQACIALLDYGAAAQLEFDHNTGDLANANIAAEERTAFDDSMIIPVETPDTALTATDTFSAEGSLSLDGNVHLHFYFRQQDTAWTADPARSYLQVWRNVEGTLTNDNASAVQLVESGGFLAAQIPGEDAKNLGNTIYVRACFVDTEGNSHYGKVIAYSAHRYASSRLDKSDSETLKTLVKAMVVYSVCAKNYFANKG